MLADDGNMTAKAACGTSGKDDAIGQDTEVLVQLTSEIAQVVPFFYAHPRGYSLAN